MRLEGVSARTIDGITFPSIGPQPVPYRDVPLPAIPPRPLRDIVRRPWWPLDDPPVPGELPAIVPQRAAITRVGEIGTNQSSSAQTTLAVTVGASGVAVGNHIIIKAACSSTQTAASIADSKGNTYQLDVNTNNSNGITVVIASCKVGTALVSGDTITITWTGSANCAMQAAEWSGLAASSWLDKVASNVGNGTAASSGSTATTAQADEMLAEAICHIGSIGGTSITWAASETQETDAASTGTIRSVRTGYRIVSATGTYAAAATLGTTRQWAAGIATYKAASGGTTHDGALSVAGSGSISPAGALTAAGALATAGAGTLGQAGSLLLASATLAASGSGSLVLLGSLRLDGALAATGTGAATFGGTIRLDGALATAGSGSLTAGPQMTYAGALAMTGVGAAVFTGEESTTHDGAVSFSGTGSYAVAPSTLLAGMLALEGAGTAVFRPAGVQDGALALAGAGSATFAASSTLGGILAELGLGTLAITGHVVTPGQLAVTGAGQVSPAGRLTLAGILAAAGAGSMTAAGDVTAAGSGLPRGIAVAVSVRDRPVASVSTRQWTATVTVRERPTAEVS